MEPSAVEGEDCPAPMRPRGMCPLRILVIFLLVHLRAAVEAQEASGEVSVAEDLSVSPRKTSPLYEHHTTSIQVLANQTLFTDRDMIQVRASIRPDWLTDRAILLNTSLSLTRDYPVRNLTIRGVFAGYAWADLQYCRDRDSIDPPKLDDSRVNSTKPKQLYCQNGTVAETTSVEIIVVRKQRTVDRIFTGLIIALVITANFGMGCTVDMEVVKAVLKRPVGPLIGFLCQFGIMPPLAFGLGKLFGLTVSEQLGILAVGASPGGGASNMWTMLYNGDVNLSITMTLISTLASLGMFPLWMFTLGKVITDEAQFTIPFKNIITSLVGLLVPVLIGILLQKKKPEWAKKIGKLCKPMLFIFLIFIFTFGIWVNWYMFRLFHLRLIGASMLLPWGGFIGGALIAIATRQEKSRIVAICIETGVQNVGVAIFALRLSLPQPMNDLSITASVCPSIFTAMPLIVCVVITAIRNRVCPRDKLNNDVTEGGDVIEGRYDVTRGLEEEERMMNDLDEGGKGGLEGGKGGLERNGQVGQGEPVA